MKGVARGQQQAGHVFTALPHGTHQCQAVAVGQAPVDDRRVVAGVGQGIVGFPHAGQDIDGDAGLAEAGCDEFAQTRVVFDKQDAVHRGQRGQKR